MLNRKYSIRKQMIFLTMLPLMVIVVSLEAFFLHDRYANLENNLLKRGQLIARQLAASSEYGVFSGNRAFLASLAESVLKEADVKRVIVVNNDSGILASAGKVNGSQTVVNGNSQSAAQKTGQDAQWLRMVNGRIPVVETSDALWLYQPILSTQIALDDADTKSTVQKLGAVIIEMSWLQTRKQESRLLWFSIVPTAAFSLAILYLMLIASRRITEPISRMSETIHALGTGNMGSRVSVSSHITELNTLISGINQMAADLQHERGILQHRIDEATAQLRHMAFYDTLTKLPNRRLLDDRLTHALAASQRGGYYGALMFLDLDNFKQLNDQFGHVMGDMLLVEVARRISGCLRSTDTVARFGGDEFVVMLSELSVDYAESVYQANIVAEKIRTALEESYILIHQAAGQSPVRIEHHCSSSIGVVL
ncbi:MAG: diguanylate cyclase domain-containing protein, partial [Burkholderiales bacterium]